MLRLTSLLWHRYLLSPLFYCVSAVAVSTPSYAAPLEAKEGACWFVAGITIRDETAYQRYLAEAGAVFAKFKGRYLAVDKAPLVLEGDWCPGRLVLIEFPSRAEAERWYFSEDYQRILKHRLAGAVSRAFLLQAPSVKK